MERFLALKFYGKGKFFAKSRACPPGVLAAVITAAEIQMERCRLTHRQALRPVEVDGEVEEAARARRLPGGGRSAPRSSPAPARACWAFCVFRGPPVM